MSGTIERGTSEGQTFVDAEIIPTSNASIGPAITPKPAPKDSRDATAYIVLPLIFLSVTLLGGFRFGASDNAFLFVKPELICLVYSAIVLVLFARSGLVRIEGWVNDSFPILRNAVSVAILLTLFTATTQIFNSVMPEHGLAFWVVAFFFFWTLWNNLFAEFDARKSLRSVGAMFALAFVAKYLILANLTAAPSDGGWLARIFENPGKEALTWLLDLPRYGTGSGYVQFFALALYILGLYLTPATIGRED